MRSAVLVLAVAVAVLAACGEKTEDAGSGGGDVLRIEVRANAKADPHSATLTCGAEPEATGFIEDATAACEVVRESKDLLLHGLPGKSVCTQIYGGPQEARITGTLDGSRVDLAVTRSDGCQIGIWDRLEGLIGAPPA